MALAPLARGDLALELVAAAAQVLGRFLFVVAVIGALAFTGGDSGAGNGSMTGHTMSDGETMTRPMHSMSGGKQMPGMTHTSP